MAEYVQDDDGVNHEDGKRCISASSSACLLEPSLDAKSEASEVSSNTPSSNSSSSSSSSLSDVDFSDCVLDLQVSEAAITEVAKAEDLMFPPMLSPRQWPLDAIYEVESEGSSATGGAAEEEDVPAVSNSEMTGSSPLVREKLRSRRSLSSMGPMPLRQVAKSDASHEGEPDPEHSPLRWRTPDADAFEVCGEEFEDESWGGQVPMDENSDRPVPYEAPSGLSLWTILKAVSENGCSEQLRSEITELFQPLCSEEDATVLKKGIGRVFDWLENNCSACQDFALEASLISVLGARSSLESCKVHANGKRIILDSMEVEPQQLLLQDLNFPTACERHPRSELVNAPHQDADHEDAAVLKASLAVIFNWLDDNYGAYQESDDSRWVAPLPATCARWSRQVSQERRRQQKFMIDDLDEHNGKPLLRELCTVETESSLDSGDFVLTPCSTSLDLKDMMFSTCAKGRVKALPFNSALKVSL